MKKVLMLMIAIGAVSSVASQTMKTEAAEILNQMTDSNGLTWLLYDDNHVSVDGIGKIDSLTFDDIFSGDDCYVLEIGAEVTGINPYSVNNSIFSHEISISEDNPYIETKDYCIVNKVTSEIIVYYGPKNITAYTVPEGVTGIGKDAFYNLNSLAEVTLTEDRMTISSYAFSGCDNLRIFKVPDYFCSTTGEYSWDGSYGNYDCDYCF